MARGTCPARLTITSSPAPGSEISVTSVWRLSRHAHAFPCEREPLHLQWISCRRYSMNSTRCRGLRRQCDEQETEGIEHLLSGQSRLSREIRGSPRPMFTAGSNIQATPHRCLCVLPADQPRKQARPGGELRKRSLLYYLSLVDHIDPVCVANRAQPMSNQNPCRFQAI